MPPWLADAASGSFANDRRLPRADIDTIKAWLDQGAPESDPADTQLYRGHVELQADLDDWMGEYNRERSHSGKDCYGKTPMQTFLDSQHLAHEKMLDRTLATSSDSVKQRAEPETERSHAERSEGGGVARGAAA